MEAASTAGYASRALPLFYAVSQAGRAIAAAWADEPWKPTGHGLTLGLAGSPLRSTIRPVPATKLGKVDTFSCVAAAAEHGTLTRPVELGALWASLPDLWEQDLRDERWRRPLPVRWMDEEPAAAQLMGWLVRATILFKYDRHLSRGLFARSRDISDDEVDRAVEAEMSHYPRRVDNCTPPW